MCRPTLEKIERHNRRVIGSMRKEKHRYGDTGCQEDRENQATKGKNKGTSIGIRRYREKEGGKETCRGKRIHTET